LRCWGLQVELGRHVFSRQGHYHYLAGTDSERLADLNEAFSDSGVRAVFAALGGKGSYRIASKIDFAAVRADPKPVVGFSDIGFLHLGLWLGAGLVCLHGPMACWNDDWFGADSAQSLRSALMTTDEIVLRSDPAEPSAELTTAGRGSGVLLGGNLTVLSASLGWNLPSFNGAILFLEIADATLLGGAEMALNQLIRSGALDGIQAVAVGQVGANYPGRRDGRSDILDVLRDQLGRLEVPLLGGLRLGHGLHPLTIPLGTSAALDADSGTVVVSAGTRR
jgi:muramoyltetrapeptide carboxypeptidase